MFNLVALVMIATSGAPQQSMPLNAHIEARPPQSAPEMHHLTKRQKAWFAHAVNHILKGR